MVKSSISVQIDYVCVGGGACTQIADEHTCLQAAKALHEKGNKVLSVGAVLYPRRGKPKVLCWWENYVGCPDDVAEAAPRASHAHVGETLAESRGAVGRGAAVSKHAALVALAVTCLRRLARDDRPDNRRKAARELLRLSRVLGLAGFAEQRLLAEVQSAVVALGPLSNNYRAWADRWKQWADEQDEGLQLALPLCRRP